MTDKQTFSAKVLPPPAQGTQPIWRDCQIQYANIEECAFDTIRLFRWMRPGFFLPSVKLSHGINSPQHHQGQGDFSRQRSILL